MLRSLLDTTNSQAGYVEALVLGVSDLTTLSRNQVFKELLRSFPHQQVAEILTSHVAELHLGDRCNIITQLLEDLAPVDRVEVLACSKRDDLVNEGSASRGPAGHDTPSIAGEFAKLAVGADGSSSMAATTAALVHQISLEAHSSRATPAESLAASMVLAGLDDLKGSRLAFLEALPAGLPLEDGRDLLHYLEMAGETSVRQGRREISSDVNQQTSVLLLQADTIPEAEKMPLLEVRDNAGAATSLRSWKKLMQPPTPAPPPNPPTNLK